MKRPTLRLGTRKSMLAWAQSSIIAQELERKHKQLGLKVELIGIVTKGDQISEIPLHQIDGKEFFVKELDDALMEHRVDFNVHSLKDLSAERPVGITLVAVPEREDPRDVIVFGPDAFKKISAGKTLRIGTSSPRRIENVPDFLLRALPKLNPDHSPQVELVNLRGNVNTRLSRLYEESGGARHLDGVVLALAGLSRLATHHSTAEEIFKLTNGLRMMVMPLTHCPTAPGQGALALECRANDFATRELLKVLDHAPTRAHVNAERLQMAKWGGGCHQKFGVTFIETESLGLVGFKRGKLPGDVFIDEVEFAHPPPPANIKEHDIWDGMQHRAQTMKVNIGDAKVGEAVLVASSAAVDDRLAFQLRSSRVWAIGTKTWFKLAAKGIFVEGCGEGMGVQHLLPTLSRRLLNLPNLANWTVLTHANAADAYEFGKVISPYKIKYELNEAQKKKLSEARYVFWSSGSQFAALGRYARPDAIHSSGPGKTAQWLQKSGVRDLLIFPSAASWRLWLTKPV